MLVLPGGATHQDPAGAFLRLTKSLVDPQMALESICQRKLR